MTEKISNKKGETYIDVAINVMIFAFILVFSVNMVSILATNQKLKATADHIIDYTAQNGSTDVDEYIQSLREKNGIDFDCSFEGTDYLNGRKVQLGDRIECKLTYRVSIIGFGNSFFPITMNAWSCGISEVYWK